MPLFIGNCYMIFVCGLSVYQCTAVHGARVTVHLCTGACASVHGQAVVESHAVLRFSVFIFCFPSFFFWRDF